ncbi:MAG: hypothetical protein WBA16_10370 [Nonlabens sp.]
MGNRKLFSVLNLLSVIVLIAWNGYANTGNFNGKTVGDLSAEYNNLFTPASYAFSIWGLIFIMLLVFGIYGVYQAFSSTALDKVQAVANRTSRDYEIIAGNANYDLRIDFVNTTAPWFLIANLFCTAWVAFWLEEMIEVSVICMLGILVSLVMCLVKLRMEVWDAPFPVIAMVWWPLCLYSGWISVATVANVAAWLNSIYDIDPTTQIYATVAMIAVAVIINLLMIIYKNLREFAMVGVWALIAIFVRHNEMNDTIAYTALAGALILLVVAGIHGARNQETNPFKKLMEWRAF